MVLPTGLVAAPHHANFFHPFSPICSATVDDSRINAHLDSGCAADTNDSKSSINQAPTLAGMPEKRKAQKQSLAPIFSHAKAKRPAANTPPDDIDDIEILEPGTSRTTNGKGATEPIGSSSRRDEPPPAKRLKTTTANIKAAAPLAERMRPQRLSDVVGHEHITGKESLLLNLIEGGGTGSMILVSYIISYSCPDHPCSK